MGNILERGPKQKLRYEQEASAQIRPLLPEQERALQTRLEILMHDQRYLGALTVEASKLMSASQLEESPENIVAGEQAWAETLIRFLESARQNGRKRVFLGESTFGHSPDILRPGAMPTARFIDEQYTDLELVITPDDLDNKADASLLAKSLQDALPHGQWTIIDRDQIAAADRYLQKALNEQRVFTLRNRGIERTPRTTSDEAVRLAAIVNNPADAQVGMYFGNVAFQQTGFVLGREGRVVTTLEGTTGHTLAARYPVPSENDCRTWEQLRHQADHPTVADDHKGEATIVSGSIREEIAEEFAEQQEKKKWIYRSDRKA